eukprot:CAMPEP_0202857354 /NCGR_PEP_ID=MMETSP1391-20130828/331_1 /ASSEMBLY_ACC=CAM_ASM_000867 /TAXON_ID=1034604 /ORGANISM="Chlamydomonas leiostraca, Strain SAG 11-49" /LENGTH=47 /DNA_ID= /DNA_START= /DNA_END= /DNA_ORIENTATION=
MTLVICLLGGSRMQARPLWMPHVVAMIPATAPISLASPSGVMTGVST